MPEKVRYQVLEYLGREYRVRELENEVRLLRMRLEMSLN
jgi:hypothetical protein